MRWKEKKKEKLYEYSQEFEPVLRLSVLASHCTQLYSWVKCTRKLFIGIGQQEAQNHDPRAKEDVRSELLICIYPLVKNAFQTTAQGNGVQAELSENRDQCSGKVVLLKFTGQDKGEKGDTQKGDLERGHPQDLAESGFSGRGRWVEIQESHNSKR